MSAARIEKLRAGRNNEQVQLQSYNNFRSRQGGKLVCAFEGHDDVTFYETMFGKISANIRYVPYVCLGKDKVLQLRQILARNVASDSHLMRYFIDHDFDGLKGQPFDDNLYVTPCYSIENLLVGQAVLEGLLRAEYRCHDEYAAQDVAVIGKLFEDRVSEFISCMRDVNCWLHSARTQGIILGEMKDDIEKYLRISLKAITTNAQAGELQVLIGYASAPDVTKLTASLPAFEALDPMKDWRGKFWFAFFRKFLKLLKDDRGTKNPQYFTQKAGMSFNADCDIIRSLASMIAVPQCLHQFGLRMIAAQPSSSH